MMKKVTQTVLKVLLTLKLTIFKMREGRRGWGLAGG